MRLKIVQLVFFRMFFTFFVKQKQLIIFVQLIMNKKKINKAVIMKSIAKMVTDKEIVSSYMKGNVDFKTLKEKGIKIANPL